MPSLHQRPAFLKQVPAGTRSKQPLLAAPSFGQWTAACSTQRERAPGGALAVGRSLAFCDCVALVGGLARAIFWILRALNAASSSCISLTMHADRMAQGALSPASAAMIACPGGGN
jgi:hypothetical protein